MPANIGDLTALTSLEMDSNNLSGTLPASLGNLTDLTTLRLQYNQFSGQIPEQLGAITGPTSSNFSLDNNRLTGCVPLGWNKYLSKINPQQDAAGNDVNLSVCIGQVAQPTVTQRNGGAEVAWTTPTGGTPTSYGIQYRPCLVTLSGYDNPCVTYDLPPSNSNRKQIPAWSPWGTGLWMHGIPSGETTATASPHTVNGMNNGVRYQVRVRGVNSSGAGPWSTPSDDVWLNQVQTATLTASAITGTTATVTIDGGPAIWWLKRTTPASTTCTRKTTSAESLSSLPPGTSYTYKAYDTAGCNSSDEIDTVTFSTLAATVTVSNLSETQATNASGNVGQILTDNIKYAASFTTGSNTGGYTLQSVTVKLGAATGSPPRPLDGGNLRRFRRSAERSVATLSGNSDPEAAGDYIYTCSTGCDLSASTTYHLGLSVNFTQTGYYSWRRTTSVSETQRAKQRRLEHRRTPATARTGTWTTHLASGASVFKVTAALNAGLAAI